MSEFDPGRRRVMQAVGAGLLLPGLAPAVIASVKDRPQLTDGVQSGDLLGDRAIIWSRSDRPARMVVEWDTRSLFPNPRRFVSPLADARTDFTARVELTGLPADQAIFYRVQFRRRPERRRQRTLVRPFAQRARRPGATFVLSGAATLPARASASTRTSAACASTKPCVCACRTFLSTAATPSTPTARTGAAHHRKRPGVAQHHQRSQEQSRRNPRRLPRQLPLQPDGRKHPPLQRRSPADLAVG